MSSVEARVEDSIYLRSGAYHVRVRVRGRARTGTVDSLREARQLREELRALRDQPHQDSDASTRPDRMLFGQWWDKWSEGRRPDLAPATYANYRSLARNHVLPAFGDWLLTDIKVSDIVHYRNQLDEKIPTQSTVDRCITHLLGGALNAAAMDGLIEYNPVMRLPKRRRQGTVNPHTQQRRYLTPQQVALIEHEMGERYGLILRFQADTALRIGEVRALQVRDVDLALGLVSVTKSMRRDGSVGPPKSRSGFRQVALISEETAEKLRRRIAHDELSPRDLLFVGPRGAPLCDNNLRNRHLRPALARLGLDHIRVGERGISTHWFRHTAITELVRGSGLGPMEVAALAGHADSVLTERTYTHIDTESLQQVRASMEKFRRAQGRWGQTA